MKKQNSDSPARSAKFNQPKSMANRFTFPALLFGLTILSYGLLTPWQGFYIDDWYIVLFQQRYGASSFVNFFSTNRPFLGYVYNLFIPVFRDSRIGWQIFALVTHWLAATTFWILLNEAFPKYPKIWKAVAVFFLVFPGFQFHWFAIMYSQVFLLLCVYFCSYIFMLQAYESRQKWHSYLLWTLAALTCLIIGILPQEYFYGLELFRPILLWLFIRAGDKESRNPIRIALIHWLPYLGVVIAYTYYRVFLGTSYSYKLNGVGQLATGGFESWIKLAKSAYYSVYNALITSWIQAFNRVFDNFSNPINLTAIGLFLLGFAIIYLILTKNKASKTDRHSRLPGWELIISGLFLTVVALVPFVAASLPVSLDFPYNRFLIALAPGVSIFVVGVAEQFLRTEKQKVFLLSFLAAISIGSQFITSHEFVSYWKQQSDFFWQLSWRAPSLKPGTALVTEDLPFSRYFSGPSLSAPLNFIYSPDDVSKDLEQVIFLTAGPQSQYIPEYLPDKQITQSFRRLEFSGSTDQMLVFIKPYDSCLRLLSPSDSTQEFINMRYPDFWEQAVPLSNLSQVITNPDFEAIPPNPFFGKENTTQWCYYFEKAELARQQEQWQAVIDIYDQADSLGFEPNNIPEWIPLMEAYIQTGQMGEASAIDRAFKSPSPDKIAGVCNLYQRSLQNNLLSSATRAAIAQLFNSDKCKEYKYP